jgi:hypothetical protein
MALYFIVVGEVHWKVVIVESLGVDLEVFFALLQFLHLFGLGKTDTPLMRM